MNEAEAVDPIGNLLLSSSSKYNMLITLVTCKFKSDIELSCV